MEFASPDLRDDTEHSDVGFVKIAKILVVLDALFFGTEPFDRVNDFHIRFIIWRPVTWWYQRVGIGLIFQVF